MSSVETAVVPAERAAIVAERLVLVRREISSRFVEMAELLLEARRGHYATVLGYPSFEKFVEQTMDMGYRKAVYLADCFKVFIEDLHIPRGDLEEIGWSKAAKLLPVVKTDNVAGWIQDAKDLSTADLDLKVRKSQAPSGQSGDLEKYSTFGIGMFDHEREIVEQAIEFSKRENGNERAATALVRICEDYLVDAIARQAEALNGTNRSSS